MTRPPTRTHGASRGWSSPHTGGMGMTLRKHEKLARQTVGRRGAGGRAHTSLGCSARSRRASGRRRRLVKREEGAEARVQPSIPFSFCGGPDAPDSACGRRCPVRCSPDMPYLEGVGLDPAARTLLPPTRRAGTGRRSPRALLTARCCHIVSHCAGAVESLSARCSNSVTRSQATLLAATSVCGHRRTPARARSASARRVARMSTYLWFTHPLETSFLLAPDRIPIQCQANEMIWSCRVLDWNRHHDAELACSKVQGTRLSIQIQHGAARAPRAPPEF